VISHDSLYNDHQWVDLKEDIILLKKSEPTIDVSSATYSPKSSDEIHIPNCLFRQASSRTSGVVRQIFSRGVSIANIHVDTIDGVVEIWNSGNVKVRINDVIRRSNDQTEYEVMAFDEATGGTRLRCAVRRVH
jgi:hypothetical protein